MFGEKLLIKKYPYLGYSENLIEYFSIIGYSENFIPELISTYKQKFKTTNTTNNNNNQCSSKNKNPYPPTVLSSITSKTDYGIVDNELIITQIYPENPKLILSGLNQPTPEKSSVIYSFCFDSTDGKEKLFYTCFGYKFYELYQDPNTEDEYYIPKAFCIISQYPFFNAFYLICKNLYNSITNNTSKIPFEILVYNIVNYIPSPMNSNLELYLFGNENEKIELNQLNGYPNIDFDLYEIFNLLPLNLILEVYMLSFLEQSILFFSSNLELLNTIMYIINMFNYPCNDTTYFWHIVSVSKKNLVEENRFVGKIMSSLLGVNTTYDDSINTFAFGSYHYVVDIDNKKIYFKESLNISFGEREEMNKLIQLVGYIESIFKEKSTNSHFLKQPLTKLKKNLEEYLDRNIPNFSSYFSSYPNKNVVNFFKDEIKSGEMNKKILEFFYDCNLTILTKFYNDNQLNTSFDKIVQEEGSNFDDSIASVKSYNEEEKNFVDIFRNTVKYKIYFDNFMQDFDVMDVFKIPFLFSRIFIELKIKEPNKICCDNMEYFNVIDQLYRLNNKKLVIKKLNFNIFNQHYIESLSQYFKKFYVNEYENNIFDKIEDENQNNNMIIIYNPKYKLINLNKKIINRYIYLLQNFYEKQELETLFPCTKIKEDKNIKIIDRRLINQVVKNKLIEIRFISSLNFLIYALVYVVCLTITFHPFDKMISYLLDIQNSIKLINFFMGDYLYKLIKSIYKYYLINRKTRKFPYMTLSHVKMYFCVLANFIRQKFIVPNEEMMVILKNFFSEIIFQERKELNILDEENRLNLNKRNLCNEDVYKTGNYMLFMKYCFSAKGIYKSKTMVNRAMEELGNCNVIIKNSKRISNPRIVIKIKEYVYNCRFLSPQKLCKDAENLFEDLFDNYNLDFVNLNIGKLRELILNLIQYGSELEDKTAIPVGFLINTLYILKNFEEIYQIKDKVK